MALDVARITDVLTRALLRDLGDEVDLVFRYGSRVTGRAHRYAAAPLFRAVAAALGPSIAMPAPPDP
jgi:hypothetical protein